MLARYAIGSVIICSAFATAACGGDDCATEAAGDGTWTIAAGPMCVDGVRARALRAGQWSDDGVALQVTERANGAVVTIEADGGADAFELRLPAIGADRMLQQGHQSWSFSGATRIPASVPLHADGAPAFAAAGTGDVFDEALGVSYQSAVVGDGDGPYLTIGAVTTERAYTGVAATASDGGDAEVVVVYNTMRESLGVAASEPIAIVGTNEPGDGLADLAAAMGDALPAGTREPLRPPGGWFSWNERFEDIDQQFVRDHIVEVGGALAGAGMPLVEIDDGWSLHWGDWRDNARFDDGMEALGGEITGAGLVAGVWMAPFLVDVDSETAATIDPLFVVRDENGDPKEFSFTGIDRTFYVLDGNNPVGFEIATDHVERLAAAGYTFFKFDYLFAGSLAGTRNGDVSGVEALRAGMELLREAAGPDAVINACGTPITAVIGLADSIRVGADTAFTTSDLDWSMVAFAARSYAARAHLHPLIWPDADQVQLRSPYSAEQARAGAVVSALAGPAYALGDDLTALPDERLAIALDDTVLDISRAPMPALPVDLLDEPVNEVVTSPAIEAIRYPNATEAPPPTEFRVTGASGSIYAITFDWVAEHGVSIAEQ